MLLSFFYLYLVEDFHLSECGYLLLDEDSASCGIIDYIKKDVFL
jgi:hypothetical protein